MIANKKAAMEMSIGTVVTIVLLMSVLVLGLVLITNIFSGGEDLADKINEKALNQVDSIFKSEGAEIAIIPSDKLVSLKQGSNTNGFAFAINNKEVSEKKFTYTIFIDPLFDLKAKCGSLTQTEATSWLLEKAGTITLARSSSNSANPIKILFNVPETAPICTIPYTVNVKKDGETYAETKVYITIVSK
jgi:hypothetical protein